MMSSGSFKLSNTSLRRLEGVHPDLVRVIKKAITITPIDFGISEGLRDIETQKRYLAEKKTTTLNSKHLPQGDGYSHAVDIYVLVNGKANYEHNYFRKAIQAIFTVAIEEGVQVEVGALWRDFLDSPHIQLNGRYYG